MKKDLLNIFGLRLRQARIMKGLSMEKLGQMIQPAVSRQAINKYEKGLTYPDSKMLISLCNALGVKPDDFFQPFTVKVETIYLNDSNKLPKKVFTYIKEKIYHSMENYLEIEQLLDAGISSKLPSTHVRNNEDVIEFAKTLRRKLRLGIYGIVNVKNLLENQGIKIFELSLPDSMDSLNGYTNEKTPLIIINSKMNVEHKRFCMLRELSRMLIITKDYSDKEDAYDTFAREMLLPSGNLKSIFGNNRQEVSLVELKDVQTRYGISIDHLMKTLVREGIITGRHYNRYKKRKRENPEFKKLVDQSPNFPETSSRFERLVCRAYTQGLVSLSKAATLLNVSESEIMDKC